MKTTQALPGAKPFSEKLQEKIDHQQQLLVRDYLPRTHHLNDDNQPMFTNRLLLSASPYLLQHAHNPVNWYPWGDEAFAQAVALNRPVFLSVGYSTCHWCHVMEEESFEDIEIATYLNQHFIAIKVDREERPDIDALYMKAVQALTGQGGWPMTVFLTPQQQPFYAGTYYPARDGDRGPRAGFLTVIQALHQNFSESNDDIQTLSSRLTKALQQMNQGTKEGRLPSVDVIANVVKSYQQDFDPVHGGVGSAPKFPSFLSVGLLLRYVTSTDDHSVLAMVDKTLTQMRFGGIYDFVGGGFHRYATDSAWLIPHFEKMLYDNALLVSQYLAAYQYQQNPLYADTAQSILTYVLRDMRSPEGAFYAATDADNMNDQGLREEGHYFTWQFSELTAILSDAQINLLKMHCDISETGQFEGRNILHTHQSLAQSARQLSISEDECQHRLSDICHILWVRREQRHKPLRDEKILAAWNGLMISAFAKASFVFKDGEYQRVAIECANFIYDHMRVNGYLNRGYKNNTAYQLGFLDDYAMMVAAFLDLYAASFDIIWLERAVQLDQQLADLFEDTQMGGYFMISLQHETLLTREKPSQDGAMPCGNSIAIMNTLRLYQLTIDTGYLLRAERALKYFSTTLTDYPKALADMLLAVDFYYQPKKQIIILTPDEKSQSDNGYLDVLRHLYQPNVTIICVSQGKNQTRLGRLVPLVLNKELLHNQITVYACEEGQCDLPITELDQFKF